MTNETLYTVSKCREDDVLYGPIHGSMDANDTLCGQYIDHHWYVLTNSFDGTITCKKCLRVLKDSLHESQNN